MNEAVGGFEFTFELKRRAQFGRGQPVEEPVPIKSNPAVLSGRLSQLEDVPSRYRSLQGRRSDAAAAIAIAGLERRSSR